MILECPTPDDFYQKGVDMLNLAWDQLMEIYLQRSYLEEWAEEEEQKEFLLSAQRPLGNSVVLVQQSMEFFLKSRICEVSPYLLLVGPPSNWPRGCGKTDTAFADFKTIDAQDLQLVCNAVCEHRLPEGFSEHFEELRRRRNTVIHSISQNIDVDLLEVAIMIFETSHYMCGERSFPKIRMDYLGRTTWSFVDAGENRLYNLSEQLQELLHLLPHKKATKYFGVSKKRRFYSCQNCRSDGKSDHHMAYTAYLNPNKPNSTTVECFVCGQKENVVRIKCLEEDCKSNVLLPDGDWCQCLLCFEAYEVKEGKIVE